VNLETLSAIAQLVAAIGVIASLFYLGVQIRQNTRSQKSLVVDSLTRSLIALLGPQAGDPEQLRAFAAAAEDWHGASEADRVRCVSIFFTTFKLFENAWFQQRHGTLDREQWESWDLHIRVYYHRPGIKSWWTDRQHLFSAGFRRYLEAAKPISEVSSLSQLIRNKP